MVYKNKKNITGQKFMLNYFLSLKFERTVSFRLVGPAFVSFLTSLQPP